MKKKWETQKEDSLMNFYVTLIYLFYYLYILVYNSTKNLYEIYNSDFKQISMQNEYLVMFSLIL